MTVNNKRRGPWTHRFLIYLFSTLLTLLFVWLLGFVLWDISRIKGPDYQAIEKEQIGKNVFDQISELIEQRKSIELQIKNQREIQAILETSTNNSQQTMNQLLDMHKHNLEQGVKPTEAEQNALAESEKIFLDNQKNFQEANRKIASLSEKLRLVEDEISRRQAELKELQKPVREIYNELYAKHRFKIASLKLGFLIPLLFVVSWLVIKKRGLAYSPIIYSAFIAVFSHTAFVMHQHFPRDFFKYLAIGAAIIIVLCFLIHLIRMIAKPKLDWLIKQYKEAYMKRLCPVCSYPIERGPFKYLVFPLKWSVMRAPNHQGEYPDDDKPYSCPSCGTQLYENCKECNAIRPSLLPHCQSCGAEKTFE